MNRNLSMEDQRHVHGGGSGRGIGLENTTRWNPTKEQIRMLENLYVQGMRTPSAEQIQQITARLRAYGHIEGKNVFYWFQNHKARQREKLKREARLSYLNNFLHSAAAAAAHQYPLCPPPPPPPPPQYPCPNGIYDPCFASSVNSEMGFCPPSHPNVPQQSVGAKRRPKVENLELVTRNFCGGGDSRGGGGGYEPMRYGYGGGGRQGVDVNEATGKMISSFDDDQETLPLFPLTPTGILEGRDESPSSDGHGFCAQNSTALFFPRIVVGVNGEQGNFYDFFSQEQGCCETD